MKDTKIKILTIFGTHKELIRLYPVLDKLTADDEFESIVVSASEHQEEFDDLYNLFHITADHDLNIKRDKKFLADITNLALSLIDPLIKHHQPDLVLVQGESTTAFIGALASFCNKIPVPYETFVEALFCSHLIITDSDAIREEACALRRPALILGKASGPPQEEAVDGFKWIEPEREKIVIETSRLLENPDAYRDMISSPNPYGDGRAAERTVHAIKYYFERADRPEDVKSPAPVRSAPIALAC